MPRTLRHTSCARWLACALAAASLALAPGARAQQSTTHKEQVLALYNLGKQLLEEGRDEEACAAFEQGRRLDPTAINLMLRLGECWARIGRTASAWNVLGEAAAVAKSAGDPRATKAAEQAEALSATLSRLTIRVPEAHAAAGLEIRRDGALVLPAQWGQAIPVDPGSHTIEARAPGKRRWAAVQEVGANGASAEVAVPALEDEVAPRAAGTTAAAQGAPAGGGAPGGDGSAQRVLALVSGGLGLVGVGVGAAFGVQAMSKRDEANRDHCDDRNRCDAAGVALRDEAQSAGTASTIAFAAGAGALAAGAVLWLTAPTPPSDDARARRGAPARRTARAFAVAGPGGGALVVRGSF